MYKTVAIAPVFIAHHLLAALIPCLSRNKLTSAPRRKKAGLLLSPSRFILITTEGGSISLRTKEEGGGNYGHHGSKAAANMAGKLLANDLYDQGVTVVMIHVRRRDDVCLHRVS